MTGKVLTFYLAGHLCGIDIRYAKEINRKVEYTPVPGAISPIVGLLNLRGQVVTLFDLVIVLNFTQSAKTQRNHCIILKGDTYDSDPVGFFIDKLGDVITVTDEQCERPPLNSNDQGGACITEVVQLQDELVLIFNLDKIFAMM